MLHKICSHLLPWQTIFPQPWKARFKFRMLRLFEVPCQKVVAQRGPLGSLAPAHGPQLTPTSHSHCPYNTRIRRMHKYKHLQSTCPLPSTSFAYNFCLTTLGVSTPAVRSAVAMIVPEERFVQALQAEKSFSRPKPRCNLSGLSTGNYEGFPWQGSQGKEVTF